MTPDDPITVWLDYLKPFSTGLVVAPNVLRDLGLVAPPQRATDTADASAVIEEDSEKPALPDPWAFFAEVLGWPSRHVAGSPGGPDVPESLHVRLPEYGTTLAPTWAVRDTNVRDREAYQLLVCRLEPGIDPDGRGAIAGWEATPHQRLERLLRETEVPAGLLISDTLIRLVYAPKGETSGWLGFPIRSLGTIQGRPMLAGLKLVLDDSALFTNDDARRLPGLLKASRDAQANVSTELAAQVLGALHDLLRGLDAADPDMVRGLVRDRPEQLYEGLLTVLMRLVFVLYAEDRDLLPSRTDPVARELYEQSYSVRGLYHRLLEDASVNPDTMDERRGGWGRMLALFRLVHGGHASGFVRPKRGKLFDPDAFLFLEGRSTVADRPRVLPISDGSILRILEGLMTLQARGGARERISYRALDVEQIGSVYETVMGFTAVAASGPVLAIKGGKNNRTPIYLDLSELGSLKGDARLKMIKEAGRGTLSAVQAKIITDANSVADLAAALDSLIDERGSPKRAIQSAGMPILQPTDERRRTGSHYTPRSLTEPIVRCTLDPAFERLGADASPDAVLDLKICDPAMGSGAFLVEACRQLGSRLVEAWSRHGILPELPPDEDLDLFARRMVASRCLYGVDRNPMAADLARLSLWLATLAREHEFSFLDHALKTGDSLVGLTRQEIQAVNWTKSKSGLPLFRGTIESAIATALEGREAIRNAADDVALSVQTARHRRVEANIDPARIVGDSVVAAFFSGEKPRAREVERARVESLIAAEECPDWHRLSAAAVDFRRRKHWRPFHWEIEFPEVFLRDNPGFDAVIGNPPFLGGAKIWSAIGENYPDWLREYYAESGGKAVDIIAYFFRRAYDIVRSKGTIGLIATKTISEGDTRIAGLFYICANGGVIFNCKRNFEWPGSASVIISSIIIGKQFGPSVRLIDGNPVTAINSKLMPGIDVRPPLPLRHEGLGSFRGADTYGLGFIFSDEKPLEHAGSTTDAENFLRENVRNSQIISPYLGGDEIASSPTHAPRRYAINFRNLSLQEAEKWPELLKIIELKVMPDRSKLSGYAVAERRKKFWWQYGTDTPALRNAASKLKEVIVISQTTSHICFAIVPSKYIFSQKAIIITGEPIYKIFCILQSRIHMMWALYWGSRQGETPVYSPTECFETFPFPEEFHRDCDLETFGKDYYAYRADLMTDINEGMTKIYNRFHNIEDRSNYIMHLRELHDALDRVVLRSYGWDDLADTLKPEFLTPRIEDDRTYQGRYFWRAEQRDLVLARLLELNLSRATSDASKPENVNSSLSMRQQRKKSFTDPVLL